MTETENAEQLKTWTYRVDPLRLEGDVQAPDEESAMATAMEAALDDALDAIAGGTWELRQRAALDD